MIAAVLTMPGNLTNSSSQFIVVSEDRSTIPIATQRFAREEAGAGNGTQITRTLTLVRSTEALCSILNDRDTIFGGNGVDCIEVCTLAIQRNRNDSLRTRCDRSLQQLRIKIVGAWINIHVNRLGSQKRDGLRCRNISKTRSDYFVTWANTQGHLHNL